MMIEPFIVGSQERFIIVTGSKQDIISLRKRSDSWKIILICFRKRTHEFLSIENILRPFGL